MSGDQGQDTGGEQPGPERKPLIEYPTAYTFKVMGKQEHGFREYVRRLFHRLMGAGDLPGLRSASSPRSRGKYLSVSVTVVLLSEEQRRHVYTELHKERRVLYYL